MKFIVFIPARSGSKSILNKNLSVIGGKELILRSAEVALKAPTVDKVVFSSDSKKYIDLIKNYNKNILIHHRSKQLATDSSKVEDCVKSFVDTVDLNISDNDVIILIEPTSPFIAVDHINSLIKLYKEKKEVASAQTIVKFSATNNPESRLMFDIELNKLNRIINHKHKEQKATYYRFGNLCSAKVEFIKSGNKFLQSGGSAILIPQKYGINIDSLLELEIAQMVSQDFESLSNEG
jgi:CMP-N,N'-diacetyllegionaminic acid synthase